MRRLLLFPVVAIALGCASTTPVRQPPVGVVPHTLDDRASTGERGLIAGAAVVDITPYQAAEAGEVYVAGFQQNRRSTGVLDPVTARALYLDDGQEWIVLVSLDVVGLMRDDVEAIRALVTRDHPERVIVTTTHNHQSPDTIGFWGFGLLVPFSSGKDPAYMGWLHGRVAQAIDEAVATARPAELTLGSAIVPERVAANLWFPDDLETIDREMVVLGLDGTDGVPIATVVNFGVHAEALFEINDRISADLPGRMYGPLEQRRGGGVAMLLQGALGGMVVPFANLFEQRDVYDDVAKRIAFMDEAGARLARVADEALAGGRTVSRDATALSHRHAEAFLPLDGWIFELVTMLGVIDLEQRPRDGERYGAEVHVVELGPARFVTIPGEPFPGLVRDWKERLGGEFPFVVSMANDELGYVMTAEQFDDDTYSYEQSMSMGPETGPILDAVVERLLVD